MCVPRWQHVDLSLSLLVFVSFSFFGIDYLLCILTFYNLFIFYFNWSAALLNVLKAFKCFRAVLRRFVPVPRCDWFVCSLPELSLQHSLTP